MAHTEKASMVYKRVTAVIFLPLLLLLKITAVIFNKSKILGVRLTLHAMALVCPSLENGGLPQSKRRKVCGQLAKGRCYEKSRLVKRIF